jgi:hypothetical protein
MATKAREPVKKIDPNYLGSFRAVLTDNVLTVLQSYRRVDARLHSLTFDAACKLLESETRKQGRWMYYQFFAAEQLRGRVVVPGEMIEAELELFIANNQSLRVERVKDVYGLNVIRLYRRGYGDDD